MSDVPDGWEWTTLGEVVTPEGLFVDGDWVESKNQDLSGDVRLTQLADIGEGYFRNRSNRYLTREKAKELQCTYLYPGDVMIARMPDPIGRACPYPGGADPAITVVDVAILRPGDESVDPYWLMWTINSPQVRNAIYKYQTGSTRKRISRKNLASIPIPLPPLAEQHRIVAVLEDQISRAQAGSAQVARLLQRIDGFRDDVYASATSGKLEASASTGCAAPPAYAGVADGELPLLPPTWTWRRLGEIAEIVGGVTKDTKKQSDVSVPEFPYLRVANVQRARLELSDVAKMRIDPAKAKRLEIQEGDVLLNEGGDRDKLGRGWVWEGQIPGCIHQNHVFRIRIQDGALDPRLLAWHANGFGRDWFFRNGKQSTNLASISLSTMKLLPVPVPPAEEQEGIVKAAEKQLSILDAVEQRLLRTQRRGDHLHQSLLREAFAGRLVSQDPDDEPASVLLERIRAERGSASTAKASRKKPATRSRSSDSGRSKEIDSSKSLPEAPGKGTQDALELDL